MAESPQTTAPELNTDYIRSIVAGSDICDTRFLTEALDAVDTLRSQFAAQQVYINGMEKRWIAAPHGDDCNKTKNTPCDCWKAS